jgi:hypothetical protein
MEKKKKGNIKARALTEYEKAESAEQSKARTTDRAKPNEPETTDSSAQVAAGSSLMIPEFHADTAVLGSHYNIKKARSMEVLGEGSDRSRQSIKR